MAKQQKQKKKVNKEARQRRGIFGSFYTGLIPIPIFMETSHRQYLCRVKNRRPLACPWL